jgi:hypothetical protein
LECNQAVEPMPIPAHPGNPCALVANRHRGGARFLIADPSFAGAAGRRDRAGRRRPLLAASRAGIVATPTGAMPPPTGTVGFLCFDTAAGR